MALMAWPVFSLGQSEPNLRCMLAILSRGADKVGADSPLLQP